MEAEAKLEREKVNIIEEPKEVKEQQQDDDNDDDQPMLSSHALEALKEFLSEQSNQSYEENGRGEDSEKVDLVKIDPSISVQLLEYDNRFEQYGSDFTFYDYNKPEELPHELKHAYQIVVADPPYLGRFKRRETAELMNLHPCGFRPRHSSKLGNEFRLFTNYNPGERLGGWEGRNK
ncbi:hypothetical protein MKX01_026349 [Papaver californicum]|nr:hypothetical protein MKX01_026349 [Papaver californicum]